MDKKKDNFILFVIAIGCLFFISGLVYFVYDNWEKIPKFIQATISILLPFPFLFLAKYFEKVQNLKIIMSVSSFLSFFMVPISLGIIGNIYQLPSNFLGLMFLWVLLGSFILVSFLRKQNSYLYFILVYFLLGAVTIGLFQNSFLVTSQTFFSNYFDYEFRMLFFFLSTFIMIGLYFFDRKDYFKDSYLVENFFKPLLNIAILFFVSSGFFLSFYEIEKIFENYLLSILINIIYSILFFSILIYLIYNEFKSKEIFLRVIFIIVLSISSIARIFITIENSSISVMLSGAFIIICGIYLYYLNKKTEAKK